MLNKQMGMMEQGEPSGDPTSPDNTPGHENAESATLEGQEGDEEDAGTTTKVVGPEGEPNVSPEEQAMYDQFTTACMAMIYKDEKTLGLVLQKLQTVAESHKPTQGGEVGGIGYAIGHTAAMILISVDGAIEQQGAEVPSDIIFNAGKEIVAELVEVSISAKLAQVTQRDELFKQGMIAGAKVFGEYEMKTGKIGKNEQGEAKQQLQDAGVRPPQQAAQPQQMAQPQPPQAPQAMGA